MNNKTDELLYFQLQQAKPYMRYGVVDQNNDLCTMSCSAARAAATACLLALPVRNPRKRFSTVLGIPGCSRHGAPTTLLSGDSISGLRLLLAEGSDIRWFEADPNVRVTSPAPTSRATRSCSTLRGRSAARPEEQWEKHFRFLALDLTVPAIGGGSIWYDRGGGHEEQLSSPAEFGAINADYAASSSALHLCPLPATRGFCSTDWLARSALQPRGWYSFDDGVYGSEPRPRVGSSAEDDGYLVTPRHR